MKKQRLTPLLFGNYSNKTGMSYSLGEDHYHIPNGLIE